MNEGTHFRKVYLSHFILERVMFLVCERWAGDGDRLLFWPEVLLSTIAALLPHLGLVAQPWVSEGPKPSVWHWFSIRHLVSNWIKPSVCWLYYCLTSTCFHCSSAYLHRCISWLTARSRVNMLQSKSSSSLDYLSGCTSWSYMQPTQGGSWGLVFGNHPKKCFSIRLL